MMRALSDIEKKVRQICVTLFVGGTEVEAKPKELGCSVLVVLIVNHNGLFEQLTQSRLLDHSRSIALG